MTRINFRQLPFSNLPESPFFHLDILTIHVFNFSLAAVSQLEAVIDL